jgi:hypothetical protein
MPESLSTAELVLDVEALPEKNGQMPPDALALIVVRSESE